MSPAGAQEELIIVYKTILADLLALIPPEIERQFLEEQEGISDPSFASWVRAQRKMLCLTETQLADALRKSGIRLYQPDICMIEKNKKPGRMSPARKMKIRRGIEELQLRK